MAKYRIKFENKTVVFSNKGRKAVCPFDDDMWYVNADLKAADGTMYDAILAISAADSGEHFGTMILLENGVTDQRDKDFLKRLGKTWEEFFPYRYRYRKEIPCNDIHIHEDGWS